MVLFHLLSTTLREALGTYLKDIPLQQLEEVHMRIGQPLILKLSDREIICDVIVSQQEVRKTLELASDHSMYAYEEELAHGFLTVEGGHRIGVCGKAVMEGRRIQNMKWISAINIRVSHQRKGCADQIFPIIQNQGHTYNTLIISPPECGKTTLLRDLIRQISNSGQTVALVDERSEIASCYQGIAQNDVGMRTDVLDGCPKAAGMMLMIRSMAPQVLAVDEIGGREDVEALDYVLRCGCSVLATIHGDSLRGIQQRRDLESCFLQGWFQRFVIIEKSKNGRRRYDLFDHEFQKIGSVCP